MSTLLELRAVLEARLQIDPELAGDGAVD